MYVTFGHTKAKRGWIAFRL